MYLKETINMFNVDMGKRQLHFYDQVFSKQCARFLGVGLYRLSHTFRATLLLKQEQIGPESESESESE